MGALGTHKALGLAKAKGARFLLASTSEVYGDPLVHPQPEDYWGNVNPVGPRGVYDESKRFAEALAMAYHRYHGVETRIVRIFNTYGPRMRLDDGRVVPNFIRQALMGEPLTVYDDGTRTRSFCYVSDMVEGMVAPADVGRGLSGESGQSRRDDDPGVCPQGAGGHRAASQRSCLCSPEDERTKDDPMVRQPDITRAQQVLGWEPRVPLEEGLGRR